MQTLTDITGSHYGPNIESSENNGWGQWHRADHNGVGMDRTVATGTGFAGQYPPEVAKMYENAATTPDDLLLFFHHVPYSYKLHSGSTVIQYIYDSHYKGAEEAAQLGREWATLEGRIDPRIFDEMNGAPRPTRPATPSSGATPSCSTSSSSAASPTRTAAPATTPTAYEAEDAKLTGYTVIDVTPWEDASGGKAVSCDRSTCSAEFTYNAQPGRFDIAIQYFDLQGGSARFSLTVNGQQKAAWTADALLPSRRPHGDNSTRFTVHGIDLKPGDTIRVKGVPDKSDPAALDYIEVLPASK